MEGPAEQGAPEEGLQRDPEPVAHGGLAPLGPPLGAVGEGSVGVPGGGSPMDNPQEPDAEEPLEGEEPAQLTADLEDRPSLRRGHGPPVHGGCARRPRPLRQP